MIQIVTADGRREREVLQAMKARAAQANEEIDRAVSAIMEDVRKNGYPAVAACSRKFDGAEPYEIPPERLEAACAACPPELLSALERAAANIRDYNEKLLLKSQEWRSPDGGVVGRIVRGLSRVGIYVPGGTAAYPSSVLMNAVPAKVAGVGEIIMVTPPTENLNDAVLAAAKIAGVDRVIAVGGAQAVAALTYGAGFIPRVDKLVGPGNAYVAAAKRMAYGQLDIDMVAGPSEVLVIADEKADPRLAAADLLSQAEHDELASAILITTSRSLAEQVDAEIRKFLETLSRREIIEKSLDNFGYLLVAESKTEAIETVNQIAPEHLEIVTANPFEDMMKVRNAGAIFLGENSCEPLGDYFAGPNHILPTNGTAKFFSPLSVDDFVKKSSVIYYSRDALEQIHTDIEAFAKAEQLTAHANSIVVRFEKEDPSC